MKGHAAFPDFQNIQRRCQIGSRIVKQNIAQPTTYQYPDKAGIQQPVQLVVAQNRLTGLDLAAHQPPAAYQPCHIGQRIPSDLHGAQCNGHGVYRWEGELKTGTEVLLLIKTASTCWERLEAEIKRLHPYELPEIIAVPITAGHKPYIDWIKAGTE